MPDCPQCGKPLGGATIVCPHCGATLIEEEQPRRLWRRRPKAHDRGPSRRPPEPSVRAAAEPERQSDTPAERPHRIGRLWRRLLLALAAIAVFVGVMAGAAYYGVYMGERERQTRREAVIEEHYQAGINALNDGRHERAAAGNRYIRCR